MFIGTDSGVSVQFFPGPYRKPRLVAAETRARSLISLELGHSVQTI